MDAIIGHEGGGLSNSRRNWIAIALAIVLKKSGKHIALEDAAGYIGGYVILNDITAQDVQRREMKVRISATKGIDTFWPWDRGL